LSTGLWWPGEIAFLDPMELKQMERQLERQSRTRASLNDKVNCPHRDTPSRLGEMAVLPNTWKQRVKQNEETELYVPNERTR